MSRTHCSLFHYEPRTLQANSHCGEVYKVHQPLYSTPTTIRSWGCQPASTFLFRNPTQSFFSSPCIFWTCIAKQSNRLAAPWVLDLIQFAI